MFRIGHGFDVHRLVEGRELILGGARLDYHMGLQGHSDADVLTHAVCDALLGGAALGDIGTLFPDSDDKYANISSIELLKEVSQHVRTAGFMVENVDITVAAQAPKLSPHYGKMRSNLAGAIGIAAARISVNATPTETLGFTGRGEGIAAWAVALLNESLDTKWPV